MIVLWIAGITLGLSLIGIAFIYFRKFPHAAAADVSEAPPPAARKAEIVETRLRRKFMGLWERVSMRSQPAVEWLAQAFRKSQSKLRDLEHEYRARSIPVLLSRYQRRRLDEDLQARLDQAEAYVAEGEVKAAEDRCLQVVRLEPRSLPAFTMLGEIYIQQKEYDHAKEVYEFSRKLIDEPDVIYDHHSGEANESAKTQAGGLRLRIIERLVECYVNLDDLPKAFENVQEARRLAPASPKILDTYITVAIAYGKKSFAESALSQLKDVNPDNTNIEKWESEIQALP